MTILQNWTDNRLEWNPDYFKVNELRLPASKVWNPEVVLLNKYINFYI